jgi:hypothetical protein
MSVFASCLEYVPSGSGEVQVFSGEGPSVVEDLVEGVGVAGE